MWSFFKRRKQAGETEGQGFGFLGCDLHSHLLPGIDDGAGTIEQSVELIRGLQELGYRKLIVTPHVHGDFYNNTSEGLLSGLALLRGRMGEEGIAVELDVSAEYYLDSYFMEEVLPHKLLPFGGQHKYVLTEVSMAGWPRNFDEMLFAVQSGGYSPILAHPERYIYIEDVRFFQKIRDKGVSLQLNLLSLTGYYGQTVRKLAEKCLKEELYDFCGTDLHHERHLHALQRLAGDGRLMDTLLNYPRFKNAELLSAG